MNVRALLILTLTFVSHSLFSQTNELKESIQQIIKSKKATVGVAILGLEDKDTLSINGNKMFTMFSVIKFPTAMAVLDHVDKGLISLDKKILIKKSDLNPETYSPLRDERPNGEFEITVRELMGYAVSKSDNIAFEKLVEAIGGIEVVNKYIQQLGINNINIVSTYNTAFENILKNQLSPIAAVTLLQKAYQEKLLSKSSKELLWKVMLETSTGPGRIKGLLPIGTPVAHKTGSSGLDENGETYACNDIGIITLPSGKHFAIAVFVSRSKETEEVNERIIAEITEATWNYYLSKNKK